MGFQSPEANKDLEWVHDEIVKKVRVDEALVPVYAEEYCLEVGQRDDAAQGDEHELEETTHLVQRHEVDEV